MAADAEMESRRCACEGANFQSLREMMSTPGCMTLPGSTAPRSSHVHMCMYMYVYLCMCTVHAVCIILHKTQCDHPWVKLVSF